MLLSFTIKNFRSFKDAQSLIMVPQNNLKEYKENIGIEGKYKALKSVAILGHNASGKSNFINAFSAMRDWLTDPFVAPDANAISHYKPFAYNAQTANEPIEFEVEFLFENIMYRYGFTYNKDGVISEWLFATNNKPRARERLYFIREKDKYIVSKDFNGDKKLQGKTNNKMLFVVVCAFFNVTEALTFLKWFRNSTALRGFINKMDFTEKSARIFNNDIKRRNWILDFMKNADLSIQDISIQKKNESSNDELEEVIGVQPDLPEPKQLNYRAKSYHNQYDDSGVTKNKIEMMFDSTESLGTIKYFKLASPIYRILQCGGTFFFDELDSRLHPLLFIHIVELFNSKETNPNNAQLIFTTHNTSVLDLADMRRDQILFVEKDKGEASKIYPLSQFKVRKAQSFAKAYLFGRYGAIPALTNFMVDK